MIRLAAIGALLLGGVFYVGMRVGAQLTAEIYNDIAREVMPDEFETVWNDGFQTGYIASASPN